MTPDDPVSAAIEETLSYFDAEFPLEKYPDRETWPVNDHAGGLTVGQLRQLATQQAEELFLCRRRVAGGETKYYIYEPVEQQAVDVADIKREVTELPNPYPLTATEHGRMYDDRCAVIDHLHATGRWMVPKGKENETDIV